MRLEIGREKNYIYIINLGYKKVDRDGGTISRDYIEGFLFRRMRGVCSPLWGGLVTSSFFFLALLTQAENGSVTHAGSHDYDVSP